MHSGQKGYYTQAAMIIAYTFEFTKLYIALAHSITSFVHGYTGLATVPPFQSGCVML